jgi:hypothetical protein
MLNLIKKIIKVTQKDIFFQYCKIITKYIPVYR